ncbi:MAG: proline--tRNA ligase [Chlamydiae bacterium CG10_big_fil_rev_8_21_14_0_10_42_34]|nr:MAG: proline--tRNA ligase [Chlamydiae bacterium CG10_big_fil_rev_8_21_14_0_10_42_34]
MNKPKIRTAITPTREENYAEWYQSVLKAADLAEHSAVRGCMVIKPWGFAIWENIQRILDAMFKATGHQNAYFPLFIPLSYLQKEAQHVEGFAKECAVVTHHRLEKNSEGKLVPAGELEEPLIVRPTSEMIIGHTFAKWVDSYRDLPLLINQWANVVRWEMRTRMFLRTTEFLWQEGHTVHATKEEALAETMKMLEIYSDFCHQYLALPVIRGEKTESEKFPGAVNTYTIEAMTQDRKALQSGTSHFLGQNFSKSCEIQFQTVEGTQEYGWTTSWGVTTRLVGAMIMAHSDDDGLVLPPRVASAHIVIIPIIHTQDASEKVTSYCEEIASQLRKIQYEGQPLRVVLDTRDMRSGEKSWGWIKKGIPMRLEVGLREIDAGQLGVCRRDKPHKEKTPFAVENVVAILEEIQSNLLAKATQFRDQHTVEIETKKEFYEFFTSKGDEIHGGFALCHWNGDPAIEEKVKEDLNVTIRCIPLHVPVVEGKCIFTGEPSKQKVIFAKAY